MGEIMYTTREHTIQYLSHIGNDNPTENQITSTQQNLENARILRMIRAERDRIMATTDWWVVPDRTTTDEELAYRQALRDITSADLSGVTLDEEGNPINVPWPQNPHFDISNT